MSSIPAFSWVLSEKNMARPKEDPAVSPTLSPEKAIPILENLILKAETLHNERSDSGQRQQWTHTGEGALLAALGNKHPNITRDSTYPPIVLPSPL